VQIAHSPSHTHNTAHSTAQTAHTRARACTENNDDGRCPAPHRGIEAPGDFEEMSSDSGDDMTLVKLGEQALGRKLGEQGLKKTRKVRKVRKRARGDLGEASNGSNDDDMTLVKLGEQGLKKKTRKVRKVRKRLRRKNKGKVTVVLSSSEEDDSDGGDGGEGEVEGGDGGDGGEEDSDGGEEGDDEGGEGESGGDEGGTACESCGFRHSSSTVLADTMFLCDRCNKGYHVKCMHDAVRFETAPADWFCELCVRNKPRRTGRGKAGDALPFHEPEGIHVSICSCVSVCVVHEPLPS
jgi:hypothetical protein